MHIQTVVTKRDDPNYAQVSGYVPRDLAIRFKVVCTAKQISQSEALESALKDWLESVSPSQTPDKEKPIDTKTTER